MELSIGKNIQNSRKRLGLTQEQVADALGVSVAAVSKWETGGAYPDITLLAPLARLLGGTVDGLLGYEPQLLEKQAVEFCEQCAREFENGSFEKAVETAKKHLREYPNSAFLKLRMGSTFMMHIPCALGKEEAEKLAEQLLARAETLLWEASKSEDAATRDGAFQGLCALLMQRERYEDALKALEQIHQPLSDPLSMKVSVYYAMGDFEKSRQAAQYLLANHLFACNIALGTLTNLAREKKDYPLALRMANLSLQLSRMFERDGVYGQDNNSYLMIARLYAEQGKAREALDALHSYVSCTKLPLASETEKTSPFTSSLEFSTSSNSRSYLNRCALLAVKEPRVFDTLRDNPEFAEILKELEQLPEA